MSPLPCILLVFVFSAFTGCTGEGAPPDSSAPAPAAAEEEPAVSGHLDRMQGTWQSQQDQAAVIEIRGDRFISRYDQEEIGRETLGFVNNCDEQAADPEGEYFVVMGESDTLCYHLTRVDEEFLEYVYVARGNTLSYTRIAE